MRFFDVFDKIQNLLTLEMLSSKWHHQATIDIKL